MAKIYVASKPVDFLGIISTEKQHLYLVYDPDNDPTNGNEEIIRGGLEDDVTFDQILIEAGSDINTSEDDFEPGETPANRNYTELDVGTTDPGLIANIWDEMVDQAEALGALEGDGKYHADTDYSPSGANSNSVATSVLHHVGIEIADQPPQVGGTGNAIDLSTFPGVNNYLATDGNDTLAFELGYPKIVYDQGGNDIYTVDMNDVVPGSGILTIRETAKASSTDTLKLENIDAGDVGVFKTLNGNDLVITANGQVVGWVPGQYSGAHPLLNAVEVHPSLGSPTTIPLNDPATIPFFFPEDVPGFTPSALSAFGVAEGQTSPLVLDLDGDGVDLTDHDGATTTTFFDIDADGFAEQTAWVEADDGLLAIDTNDNGVIDDASELFGTATIDGFAKLAELDSNGDLIPDY